MNTTLKIGFGPLVDSIAKQLDSQKLKYDRAREGAEKALEWHRNECRNEWAEIYKAAHRAEIDHPFDAFQSWKVEEITIKD